MDRRIVVTGLGLNNCLGNTVNEFWESLLASRNGIGKINCFNSDGLFTFKAGQVKNLDFDQFLDKKEVKETDRFALLALMAAQDAILDSGLCFEKEDPFRRGVVLGSGIGGMMFYETQIRKYYNANENHREVHPIAVQKITPNALSGRIAMKFNCQGPNLTISTACSSSNHAIGVAMNSVRSGETDIMLAGGAEAPLMPVNFSSFDNMRVMSRNNICRPFDLNRDGFLMGEGAAILILEELEHAKKRNAKIYAEIVGYGRTCGAYHMVKVREGGADEARAIGLALENANIGINQIDYINAHGTGTVSNDISEAGAINKVFGKKVKDIYVSSIKGALGHLIGAAGATEAVATVLSINRSVIPPNVNYEKRDAQCDLNIPKKPVEKEVNIAISNAFGFGNNNAVIAFKNFGG